MKPKKYRINTDDQSTVVKNTDEDTTAVLPGVGDKDTTATLPGAGGKAKEPGVGDEETTEVLPGAGGKAKEPAMGDEEMKVIRSYWTSGSAALKRQAINRYAKLTGMSAARAEAALNEWVHLLERSK